MRNILQHRGLRLIFLANVISMIGSGMNSAGVTWYVLQATHSEMAMGTLLMLQTIPALVMLPFAGVVIDRQDRRRVVMTLDAVRGLGRGFLMGFVQGETLGGRIARGEAFAHTRTFLARQCGEVLARIHTMNPDDFPMLRRLTPAELVDALRKLIALGRPREAARRLACRPLYTLGHPRGGMLMFSKELPAFLHLATAERFAARIAEPTGGRVQQGLVAAAELFKTAIRGRLSVLIDPGPAAIRFRPEELR